jgi:hypothetical protein
LYGTFFIRREKLKEINVILKIPYSPRVFQVVEFDTNSCELFEILNIPFEGKNLSIRTRFKLSSPIVRFFVAKDS